MFFYCLTLNKSVLGSFETSVTVYQLGRLEVPDESSPPPRCKLQNFEVNFFSNTAFQFLSLRAVLKQTFQNAE